MYTYPVSITRMLKALFIIFLLYSGLMENVHGSDSGCLMVKQDTLPDNQSLINGRIWSNHYYMISGNQFLFTNKFLPGSITMKGQTFKNVRLKYDIFDDQILMPLDSGGILQLNKELVDSFQISFKNRTYRFARLKTDEQEAPAGFVNILYRGKYELAVKYLKKIDRLNIEGKVDNFYQLNRIYLISSNSVVLLRNKRDLYEAVEPYKAKVKTYLKKQMVYIDRNDPDSYMPVFIYLDKITGKNGL